MTQPELPYDHAAALQGWLETLDGVREATTRQYGRLVGAVLAAGGGQLTAEGFLAYRDAAYERGLSVSSIGVLTAAVRGFARHLAKGALISPAEVRGIWDAPRVAVIAPRAPLEMSDGFVGRMAAAAQGADDPQLRALTGRAVLVLLSGCGLRSDEAVAVQWRDYDSGSGSTAGDGSGATLDVHRPSGCVDPRTVDVPAEGARVLDELRALHRSLVVGVVTHAPILATLYDDSASAAGLVHPRPPSAAMLERVVDRLAQRAGAPPGTVGPQQLRALYGNRLSHGQDIA